MQIALKRRQLPRGRDGLAAQAFGMTKTIGRVPVYPIARDSDGGRWLLDFQAQNHTSYGIRFDVTAG